MTALRGAVGFLTVAGGASVPRPGSLGWFPAVGALLGALLGAVWWLGGEIWTPALAAAVVVTADLAFTGLLHVDGLADSADGLLPHLPRERRLAVMAEPGVGAFGVAVVGAVLLLRWSALASLSPDVWLLASVWASARAAMALAASTLPYAREAGLASAFTTDRPAPVRAVVAGAVVFGLAPALVAGPAGLAAVAGLVAGSGAVLALARRRIGGFTGDVLGAAGMVGETVALMAAAAV